MANISKMAVLLLFGGKYRYWILKRLCKLFSTNKELIGKKTWALSYLWPKLAKRQFYHFCGGKYRYGTLKRLCKLLVQIKNSFGKRTRALAYLWPKLAKWRFYCFFGGKYRYGTLKRLCKLLSTNKELIWKKNWSSILSMAKVSKTAVLSLFWR